MKSLNNSVALDAYWMPFTPNRKFKAAPRMLVEATGMHYRSDDGREILDGTAGLWCVNAGHGRKEIASAVAAQLESLDYAPSFQLGHPLAFRFAERLSEIAPPGLDRIFFTGSGSESVDTALKIALAYQRAIGQGTRTRLVGRERGYHGVGFGGISVGGLVNNRRAFSTLHGVDHMRHTHDPSRNLLCKGPPEHGAELADDLERLVQLHGADTIAAVIVEPVAGSTGVLLPPQGYLKRLREIATRHGILLIFDEVITGFGRLGSPFAAQHFDVVPDIITTAKGLTNGAMPMGAVFTSRDVHDALMQGPEAAIELFHGYTYSGHPAACAAGLASLDIYQREGLFSRAAELEEHWQHSLLSLQTAPHIADIRAMGLIAAIELAPRPDDPGSRGFEAFVDCFEKGLLVRANGDTIVLSPPLIISRDQIDSLTQTLLDVLKRTT